MPHHEASNPTIFPLFKGLGLTKQHPYFLATSIVILVMLLDYSGVSLNSVARYLETVCSYAFFFLIWACTNLKRGPV